MIEESKVIEYPGTVHGEAARKYAGYAYLKPVLPRIDIFQIDPERLHPAHEYPRSVNPPTQPNFQTVDLADYLVQIHASQIDGMSKVEIWMQPNEYTAARQPLLVFEYYMQNEMALRPEYIEEAKRKAFASMPAPPR